MEKKNLFGFIVSLLFVISLMNGANAISTSNIDSFWALSDNQDATPNNNDLTITGATFNSGGGFEE